MSELKELKIEDYSSLGRILAEFFLWNAINKRLLIETKEINQNLLAFLGKRPFYGNEIEWRVIVST